MLWFQNSGRTMSGPKKAKLPQLVAKFAPASRPVISAREGKHRDLHASA